MQLSLLNNWFSNELVKALSWTFVHSLWQGLLAALLAAIIISTTRRSSARLRYNLLGMVLILFIATAVVTFSLELAQHATATVHANVAASTYNDQLPGTISASITTAALPGGFINELSAWFDEHNNLFFLGWSLFFLLNCVKLFAGLAAVHRLRHYKTYPVPGEWKTKLLQLSDLLGIRQSVALLQSELVKVPVVLGILKPVILLPAGLLAQIPPEQVEAILLHELGHIRRKDYFVNFLQHFAEAIFFFNPAMLWVSSLLRQEREACCDDIAVANAAQKRNYLDAIVNFQEYSLNHGPYVMAISSRKNYLLNRVKRIITKENKSLNMVEKMALLAGIIIFSAFTFITPGEKLSKAAAFVPLEQMISMQQQPLKDQTTKPALRPPGKEKKKIIRPSYFINDTVPAKKDTTALPVLKSIPEKKEAIKDEDAKIKQALNDIQQIKDRIGAKKEIIGEQKEQLKESPGNAEYLEKLKKAREEVEAIRQELELKRKELYIYQRQTATKSTSSAEVNSSSTTSIDVNDDHKKLFSTEKKTLFISKSDKPVNQFKVEKQEFKYKMALQVKAHPTIFKKVTEPVNPKTPPAPGKKTAPTIKKATVI